jgi:hypothetical protein
MTDHTSISAEEAADRLAIREAHRRVRTLRRPSLR